MNRNFFLSLILLLIFSSCGYSPTFKNSVNKDINIKIMKMSGNNLINTQINSRLAVYSKNVAKILHKITIYTSEEKKDISKDSTGKTTNYQLKLTAQFDVETTKLNKKIIIEESFILNNSNDIFNINENENIIKKDFANIASEKLLAQLLLLSNQ